MPPSLGPDWLDPQTLLERMGPSALWGAAAIVFAECGLFIFFMPGDSLLFTVGLLHQQLGVNLVVACVVLSVAAFLGNVVGYEIGRAVGAPLYHREGRLIKREYFDKTHAFFDKHGSMALVLGRFVPVVRTFITVVAGIGRMDRRRFFTYSAVGAVLWGTGVTLLGAWLGHFEVVHRNIEIALILIVVVSVIPMVVEYVRHRREAAAVLREAVDAAEDIRDGR